MMRRFIAVASLTLAASAAQAQAVPGQFSVSAKGGVTRFDAASALKRAPFAGIDAVYQLPSSLLGGANSPLDLGVGFAITTSLPVTRYDQFPAISFDFGDTTFLRGVAQRVELFEYGLEATLGARVSRMRVYGVGGAGMYTIRMDPRQVGRIESRTKPSFQVGGGLNFVISRVIGLRAEVRDVVFTKYDREALDPTVAYAVDRRIRDEFGPPVAAKSTLNNLKFSLAFTYVPGASTDAKGDATTGGGQ